MFCYKSKFFSQQKYAIYMLKDEIQLCNGHEILTLQLNSFNPQMKWIKNKRLEIYSFELKVQGKPKTFKIDCVLGMLLKEFLNGKVCYSGINNQYKLAKYLSKRNYGSIVRMRYLETDELVTCKIIKQGRSQFEQEFRNEVLALQNLKHKNIAKIKEYYIENYHNYIIYQFVEGTSLENHIKKKFLSDEQIYFIMKELIQTVNYIHKEGFSHQNIILENIYYCSLLNQITIIDFGKSTQGESYWTNIISSIDSHYSKNPKEYQDLCSFTSRGVNPEKDFFDCGLVFYQLITNTILNPAEMPTLDDDSKIINLITCVHNQKASKILMKLLLLNRSPDKLNKSDEILTGFEELLNLSKE